MCNAYSLTHPREALVDLGEALARHGGWRLHADLLPEPLAPRYRVSPRQQAPILRLDRSGRLVWSMGLWGFLVAGGKPGFAPTNARDDRLTSGWPWRQVAATQRCLIPADGFFEPEKPAGAKGTVPWSYYTLGNRQLFLMAGLWNPAEYPTTGVKVASYTVVTTKASEAIRLHDRMPAILDGEAALLDWLRPGAVPTAQLGPWPAARMRGWRVADAARNSRLPDTPAMIEPVEDRAAPSPGELPLG